MKEIDKKDLADVSGGARTTGRPDGTITPPPFNPGVPTDPVETPTPTDPQVS